MVRLFRKISQGCGLSRSPFSFFHLVSLLQITSSLPLLRAVVLEKKSLKVRPLQIALVFFLFFFSFSHLPLQRSPSSSTFPTKSSLSQNSHFFLNKTLNITPQNPCNAFQNLFVSFLKVKFIQPTIKCYINSPYVCSSLPEKSSFFPQTCGYTFPIFLKRGPTLCLPHGLKKHFPIFPSRVSLSFLSYYYYYFQTWTEYLSIIASKFPFLKNPNSPMINLSCKNVSHEAMQPCIHA